MRDVTFFKQVDAKLKERIVDKITRTQVNEENDIVS